MNASGKKASWFFIIPLAAGTIFMLWLTLQPRPAESDFQWLAGSLEKWAATGKEGSKTSLLQIWLTGCPPALELPKQFAPEELSNFQAKQRVEFQIAKSDVPKLQTAASTVTLPLAGVKIQGQQLTTWADWTAKQDRYRWVNAALTLVLGMTTVQMTVKKLKSSNAPASFSNQDVPAAAYVPTLLWGGILALAAGGGLYWYSTKPIDAAEQFRPVAGTLSEWKGVGDKEGSRFQLRVWLGGTEHPFELVGKIPKERFAAFDFRRGAAVELLANKANLEKPASGLLGKDPRIVTATIKIDGVAVQNWDQYVEAATAAKRNVFYIALVVGVVGALNLLIALFCMKSGR